MGVQLYSSTLWGKRQNKYGQNCWQTLIYGLICTYMYSYICKTAYQYEIIYTCFTMQFSHKYRNVKSIATSKMLQKRTQKTAYPLFFTITNTEPILSLQWLACETQLTNLWCDRTDLCFIWVTRFKMILQITKYLIQYLSEIRPTQSGLTVKGFLSFQTKCNKSTKSVFIAK